MFSLMIPPLAEFPEAGPTELATTNKLVPAATAAAESQNRLFECRGSQKNTATGSYRIVAEIPSAPRSSSARATASLERQRMLSLTFNYGREK
jgi:hypothetical protein